MAGPVDQGGGEFDFEGFGALDEIDDGRWGGRYAVEEFCGCLFEFGARLDQVLVGLGVFDERGGGADFAREEVGGFGGKLGIGELCDECGRGSGIDIPGGAGGGVAELCAQIAHFGEGMREEAGDLRFERAGVDDLAEGGVGGERQQVAGDVEGAGLEGAVVGFGLHRLGAGDALAQGFVNGGGGALVGGEEIFDGIGVELGRRRHRSRSQGSTSRTSGNSDSGWSAPGRPSAVRRPARWRPAGSGARRRRRCGRGRRWSGGRTGNRMC